MDRNKMNGGQGAAIALWRENVAKARRLAKEAVQRAGVTIDPRILAARIEKNKSRH